MREIVLQAEIRKESGKQSRSLRRNGKVPGVYYALGEENISVSVPEKSLKPLIFTSETHIINLALDGGIEKNCILRDIQFDPITDRPIHFDLQGLNENRKITLDIPVVITGGIPLGVREGGILQSFMHRLKIACLPKDIPEHVEINAENLKINQFVHVRDIQIENISLLESGTSTIVGVIPPTVEKEETAVAAVETPAEPELIAKGKKPEEGEAAAPAKAEEKKKLL